MLLLSIPQCTGALCCSRHAKLAAQPPSIRFGNGREDVNSSSQILFLISTFT